ncbi:hypothetical protein EJD97_013522 [Solanum chilense]|uniref:Uncharacterized protein n=1 Tax=Solanum chilense TaxID=4083 RepID=A0A6N2AER0_SOLCI|nr:hypothetical protein EJD97_013522 [Solanum chilense]
MKSLKSQRNLCTKKNGAIIEHLEFSCMSVLRKPRTKTIIRKIAKKNLKFNLSMGWIGYKREDINEDAKGNDQMSDNWYSIPLSEYKIPGLIPGDLDVLVWDINTIILDFWDNIPA